MTSPLMPGRRDLRAPPPRDTSITEQLAAVSLDDVLHSQQTAAELCTPRYRMYLNAGLDEAERTP